MVQIAAMKRVKGRAPLSVVVAIIGGLALAGITFTEDLRSPSGTYMLLVLHLLNFIAQHICT